MKTKVIFQVLVNRHGTVVKGLSPEKFQFFVGDKDYTIQLKELSVDGDYIDAYENACKEGALYWKNMKMS